MRSQVVIIATMAVLAVLAALPLSKGNEEEAGAALLAKDANARSSSTWPCCDDCAFCYKNYPPSCACNDISVDGCHPECKTCVRFGYTAAGDDGPPGGGPGPVVTYRCADILTNFCKNRCTPAPAVDAATAAAAELLGAVF